MLALIGIIRWRIRGATYVQMAQVAQRSAIFWTHPTSKVGILQVLVPCKLRHVLENAQTLLDGFLSFWRQIAPGWQHVIFNMITLLRRHLLPYPLAVAHVLLLLRRQLPKALLILEHPLSLFGAKPLLIVSVRVVIVLPTSRNLPVSRILAGWRSIRVRSLMINRRPIGIHGLMR